LIQANVAGFGRGEKSIDFNIDLPFLLGFVLQHRQKHSPTDLADRLSQVGVLDHAYPPFSSPL
jgi:hypothetical protein